MPKVNVQNEAVRAILATQNDTCLVYRFITSSVNEKRLKLLLVDPYDTSTASNYLIGRMVEELVSVCGYNWVYYANELNTLSEAILNRTKLPKNSFDERDILSYTRAKKITYRAQKNNK